MSASCKSILSQPPTSVNLVFLILFFIAVTQIPLCYAGSDEDDSVCTWPQHHPAYDSLDAPPVLIRCWTMMETERIPRTVYLAKYKRHVYAPVSDLSSTEYSDLDWFWTVSGHSTNRDFIKLHFNRQARVYLAVPVHQHSEISSDVSFDDWKPMGEAQLVKGEGDRFEFGVYQTFVPDQQISPRVYVFMKRGKSVVIPDAMYIGKNVRGFNIPNGFNGVVMITEADGTKWKYPSNPSGVRGEIKPNEKCPDDLHRLWVTPNTDDDDDDTRGKQWATWHPLWDPVYWCTYAHEHGASSPDLMSYWPKYGYTAWKNGREDESNEGFKNLIMRTEKLAILYVVHMQTSQLRRVYERWHTIQLIVVERKTRRLLAEITHKGDFGALTARLPHGRFMALSKEDQELMDKFSKAPRRRSINVITQDGKRTDGLQYRSPAHTAMMGTYEDWTTSPLCSGEGRRGNLRADITRSATGIQAINKKDKMTYLGRTENGVFYRQVGQARILITREYEFSAEHCERMMSKPGMIREKHGVFYTDSMGEVWKDGPWRSHIRQYVHPKLRFELNGEFRALNSFTGLMEVGSKRGMDDIGFGIDPDIN